MEYDYTTGEYVNEESTNESSSGEGEEAVVDTGEALEDDSLQQ